MSVWVNPAEGFEVLRHVCEAEMTALEDGSSLDPVESGRAAMAIGLAPLCQVEAAVLVAVGLLDAMAERVAAGGASARVPGWLQEPDGVPLPADRVAPRVVARVRRDLADPVIVSTMGPAVIAQLNDGVTLIDAVRRRDREAVHSLVRGGADPQWLVDGCQQVGVALAAHATSIGWGGAGSSGGREIPDGGGGTEVSATRVFAELRLSVPETLVRDLLGD